MDLMLKNVRLSFPVLDEAEAFPGSSVKRYSATFLIEKGSEHDKMIRAAIKSEAVEKWGKKAEATLKQVENNSNKFCYRDGDLTEYDGYENHMALSSHRREKDGRPGVFDADKTPLPPSSGKPYAGCYVNAKVSIYAQSGEYTGIRCSLTAVQFYKDGDSFGGAKRSDGGEFEDVSEGSDASDFA